MIFDGDLFDLASIVLDVARRDPDRVAIVEPRGRDRRGKRSYQRYTYEQLSADVEAVAVGLRELGVVERTRVVFMAPPSYEACAVYAALTRVGATIMMIDPSVGYRNVGERLRRIEPEAFVGIPLAHVGRMAFGWGPRLLRKSVVVSGSFPGARSFASLRREAPAEPRKPAVSPDEPAAVLYTTGSTGPAKPALYTHRNFCNVFRIVHASWGIDPSRDVAVDMAAFPAFFTIALSAGGTVVVPPIDFTRQTPATADPEAILEVINDCGVQSLFASPVLLENLARSANARGLTAPSLKRVIGGGAPITASAMRALLEMMPNGEPFANYGATEALPSTAHGGRDTLTTWERTEAGGGICVGRPFAGVEVVIAKIHDGPIDTLEQLPRGEIGEIVVRSPHVSPRYFLDDESTRKNKIGSWHRVGDAGYLDEDGRLWVVGRVSQRVRGPRGPLFSLLCEPIFDRHPAVRRSGLVGIPTDTTERAVLCVELTADHLDADRPSLRRELLALASAHDVTRDVSEILFIDRLPVDPRHNSKIERPKLAKWAASRVNAA